MQKSGCNAAGFFVGPIAFATEPPARKAQLATSRRKIVVSGIEANGLPQNKTRRGERRA
jgi:hypothetical protein